MSLLADCPVCHRPLSWTYLLRPAWAKWHCAECGSLLGVNFRRRILAAAPLVPACLAGSALGIGLGPGTAVLGLILIVVAWIPIFMAIERPRVVERAGLRCKGCGYDLQGQVAPRCPECGRELDAAEREMLATGHRPRPGRGRGGLGWLTILVFSVLFAATLFTFGLMRYTAARKAIAARTARRAAIATQPVTPPTATQPAAP